MKINSIKNLETDEIIKEFTYNKNIMDFIEINNLGIDDMRIRDKYGNIPLHSMFMYQKEHIVELVKHFKPTTDDMKIKDEYMDTSLYYLVEMNLNHENMKLICDIIGIKDDLGMRQIVNDN